MTAGARQPILRRLDVSQCNRDELESLKKYAGLTSRISAILRSQDAPILVTPNSQAITC